MESEPIKSLAGQLLVASPKLGDSNFEKTVLLMVQHSPDGALGLILNRPLKITIDEAWEQVSQTPCNSAGHIHHGGPCEGPLMVVHTDEALSEDEVSPGIYFSAERELVEALVAHGEEPMKFFVGYSGWTAGQLETEIAEGAWYAAPINGGRVFHGPPEQWDVVMRAVERHQSAPWLDPKLIPDDPSVN